MLSFIRKKILNNQELLVHNLTVYSYLVIIYILYLYHLRKRFGLDYYIYKSEFKKYANSWKSFERPIGALKQWKTFFSNEIRLIADNLTLSHDRYEPVVIVVVKDELARTKLLFQHYRTIGAKQFVVLDNDSSDGTLEWLAKQNNTRVYESDKNYYTDRKVAWIEKLIAITGYDRWYIVVDSDELLDYIGSEKYKIKDMIKWAVFNGYNALRGFMLDMYTEGALYSLKCNFDDIPKKMIYFDSDSYILERDKNKEIDMLVGGPRSRIGSFSERLSKQPVFVMNDQILYQNSHYLYPIMKWEEIPCVFVLRHYKFLKSDKGKYTKRANEGRFCSGTYNKIGKVYCNNSNISFYYKKSVRYEDSSSLKVLRYIKDVFCYKKIDLLC